jgi:hypothetical protein
MYKIKNSLIVLSILYIIPSAGLDALAATDNVNEVAYIRERSRIEPRRPVRIDPVRIDPVRLDPVRIDPVRRDPLRTYNRNEEREDRVDESIREVNREELPLENE